MALVFQKMLDKAPRSTGNWGYSKIPYWYTPYPRNQAGGISEYWGGLHHGLWGDGDLCPVTVNNRQQRSTNSNDPVVECIKSCNTTEAKHKKHTQIKLTHYEGFIPKIKLSYILESLLHTLTLSPLSLSLRIFLVMRH